MSTDTWQALRHCAGWERHAFEGGPFARLLLHVAVDPARQLRYGAQAAARANVRMQMQGGSVFGVIVSAARASMLDVLLVVGAALAGQPYDESAFNDLDAALAAAILAAGHGRARASLEHKARVLPRPVVMPDQLARMAPVECPPELMRHWQRACSSANPVALAWRAEIDVHAVEYCTGARDRLAVLNYVAAPAGHARNRVQAMQVLPWLLTTMVSHASGNEVRGAPEILAAIDAGLPLHDAIAGALNVPREVVRWLGRQTLPADWVVDVHRLQRLLTLLSWLPPERRPQDLAQFGVLQALACALTAPLDFIGPAGQAVTLARIAPCMRTWLAQGRPADAAGLLDARDFLCALFEAVQSIDGLDAPAADAWVLAWCTRTRVARLLALSRAWHASIAAQTCAADIDDSVAHWPPVLAQPWQTGNRMIVELTSRGQLRSEGQTMAHCVGSYEAVCRSGNSVIVALRSTTGAPLSTAELSLHDSVPYITVAQHRAAGNATPAPDCARALQALLGHLDGLEQQPLLWRRRKFQREQQAGRSRAHRFNVVAQRAAYRAAMPPGAIDNPPRYR